MIPWSKLKMFVWFDWSFEIIWENHVKSEIYFAHQFSFRTTQQAAEYILFTTEFNYSWKHHNILLFVQNNRIVSSSQFQIYERWKRSIFPCNKSFYAQGNFAWERWLLDVRAKTLLNALAAHADAQSLLKPTKHVFSKKVRESWCASFEILLWHYCFRQRFLNGKNKEHK